jgi:hypothetical protein
MKKCFIKKVPISLSFAISCLLLVAIILSEGCNKIQPGTPSEALMVQKTTARLLNSNEYPITQQLIIWKKPSNTNTGDATGNSPSTTDSSMKAFKRWIDSFKVNYPGTQEIICSCSDSGTLRLLYGPNVANYIQTNTVPGGQGSTKETTASGEDGPLYFSINFNVKLQLPKNGNYSYRPKDFTSTGTPVDVGIEDTGLDTTGLKNFLYKSNSSNCCILGGNNGWNFVNDIPNYWDSGTERHGTSVTRFAIDEVVYSNYTSKRSIRVLPIKTNDTSGRGDLFSMLCGFAYAQNRGVRIINASIGFPEPRLEKNNKYGIDPNVKLLQEFVYHHLTLNKILLVAAAGNYDTASVKAAFRFNHVTSYPSNYSDLDQFGFYPASLSRDTKKFWNVISVTTVDTNSIPKTVSKYQNYSPNVVDFGVKADAIIGSSYVFNNPDPKALPNGTSEGSSFAAPIITGKLCAKYNDILSVINKSSFQKYEILDKITLSPYGGTSASLTTKIRSGRYVDKRK